MTFPRLAWTLAIWFLAGGPLFAATVLFDFEADSEVRLWHDERRDTLGPGKALQRVERFATGGVSAMEFRTPQWKPGLPQWPAFECQPPITDWSDYDRLVFDVTNDSAAAQTLNLFISDGTKPTRSGLQHREVLPPWGHMRVVIPITSGFRQVGLDARDIRVMHFYTDSPPADMCVILDHFLLLEPGEVIPPLPRSYLRQFAAIQTPVVDEAEKLLTATREKVKQVASAAVPVVHWSERRIGVLEQQLDAMRARIRDGDPGVLAIARDAQDLHNEVARMESLVTIWTAFGRIREQVQTAAGTADSLAVGFATSMQKILPRKVPLTIEVATRHAISLARNEEESFQVIFVPFEQDVQDVHIIVRDLVRSDGTRFAAKNIAPVVVGYVQTDHEPPYGTSHIGWWPDPLLDFQRSADVVAEDAQAFWIRVHAPSDQPPGVYSGKLELVAGNQSLCTFDLAIRVYDFAVPNASPLPLAVTFAPHDYPDESTRAEQLQWRQEATYPINAWRRRRIQWADFLADYYFTYDSLYGYRDWSPDFEVLKRLDEQGRLGHFNLGYYGPCGESATEIDAWKKATVDRLRPAFERARALGILDRAYIYGCDEAAVDLFPRVERAASLLKAEFPGVPIMTTTYDHSYGQDSVVHSMDGWCPLTPRFDLEKAAAARAAGKQVWWYICCGPHHPHANMFIEYPAIEGRLLMGAMTAKYRPDGFLYYQISIWNSRHPIASGPFTDWDPRSWTSYHGDGSWTCVGPDGTPLPTIRLENFRDGLEDYAYHQLLEATVAEVENSDELRAGKAAWLQTARACLVVPPDLVQSLTVYSRNPAQLYAYRTALAEAIESAGIKPPDPRENCR